jgi:hypothetical protein
LSFDKKNIDPCAAVSERNPVVSAYISNKLFDHFHPENGSVLPNGLIGAEIINIGNVTEGEFKNNFLIEYKPKGSSESKQIIFSFDETVMWVCYGK